MGELVKKCWFCFVVIILGVMLATFTKLLFSAFDMIMGVVPWLG